MRNGANCGLIRLQRIRNCNGATPFRKKLWQKTGGGCAMSLNVCDKQLSLAWEVFRQKNGCSSLDELRHLISHGYQADLKYNFKYS